MAAPPDTLRVTFEVNGRTLTALAGETLLQACRRNGIDIPHLCYKPGMGADGNCRVCMVEIEGERVLAPACSRQPLEGMVVLTESKRARHAQRLVLELLLANMPKESAVHDNELLRWCQKLGIAESRFAPRVLPAASHTQPGIAVNLAACIQCTRCLRACREVQVNDVIGLALRGAEAQIVFDLNDDMGRSSCVGCGECVQACPTGALAPADGVARRPPERSVETVCPYCGVGCRLTYHVRNNRIVYVEGSDGPANLGRLCVKGRYGFDYIHHPHRLTKPLIRKEGAPKSANATVDPADPSAVFREASWDEALEAAASGLKRIIDRDGPQGLAGFGSAKGSNEEAYLFQKLVRTGLGSNNVDHCTRLCHASSVAALLEMLGSGAVSNPVADVAEAEVIVVIGSNTEANHPVAATFIKNAVKAGKTLIAPRASLSCASTSRTSLLRRWRRCAASMRPPSARLPGVMPPPRAP